MYKATDIDDLLIEILEEIFDSRPNLFPPSIESKESIREFYHCFRTFRRTSDSRAIEQNVNQVDIDIVNRWQKLEKSKGRRPNQPMKLHYAEFQLLLKPFIRYTFAM